MSNTIKGDCLSEECRETDRCLRFLQRRSFGGLKSSVIGVSSQNRREITSSPTDVIDHPDNRHICSTHVKPSLFEYGKRACNFARSSKVFELHSRRAKQEPQRVLRQDDTPGQLNVDERNNTEPEIQISDLDTIHPCGLISQTSFGTSGEEVDSRVSPSNVVCKRDDHMLKDVHIDGSIQVHTVVNKERQSQVQNLSKISQRYVDRLGILSNLLMFKKKSWRGNIDFSRQNQDNVMLLKDDITDFRPFFTYWKTTVDVIVMLVIFLTFDLTTIGVGLTSQKGLIFTEFLTLEQLEYFHPTNAWIGPSVQRLIRLGAKFTPCIRTDPILWRKIEDARKLEIRDSGCCVRNDRSGCFQTTQDVCSPTFSTFHKWNDSNPGVQGRISGPVCGQDPRYCSQEGSQAWPDDIGSWPICPSYHRRKSASGNFLSSSSELAQFGDISFKIGTPDHIGCEVTAKPCCIGIHGHCQLKSEEFCTWVGGTFHSKARLCSQVSCMSDVCGISTLSFDLTTTTNGHVNSSNNRLKMSTIFHDIHSHGNVYYYKYSNVYNNFQIYRLVYSLFLHAGLIHLLLVVVFQLTLMRDLEKMVGSTKLIVIYFTSGVIGNLASAVFIPYRAEVGPSSSLFAVLSAFHIQIWRLRYLLSHPYFTFLKLAILNISMFTIGLLFPFVDNYAHIFGFISGLLLSSYLLNPVAPLVVQQHSPVPLSPQSGLPFFRQSHFWICFMTTFFMFLFLLILLYAYPDLGMNCEFCKFLTCFPLSDSWCGEQNIDYRRAKSYLF